MLCEDIQVLLHTKNNIRKPYSATFVVCKIGHVIEQGINRMELNVKVISGTSKHQLKT